MPTLPWPSRSVRPSLTWCFALVLVVCAGCAGQIKGVGNIPELSARLARDSADHETRTRLGIAYLEGARPDEARPLLETAVARRPGDARSTLYLGLTYEALKQYAQARQLYENYLKDGRSRALRADLTRRLTLLQRQELEAAVKVAVENELRIPGGGVIRERSVAVFPFQVLQSDTTLRPLGRALAELLVVDLSQTTRITVLERLRVQLLLDEIKLSSSGLVDQSQAVRGGRMLGAERIVQGSLGGQAQSLELSAAIVRVQDAVRPGGEAPLSVTDALNRVVDAEKQLALRIYESLGVQLTVAERERVIRRPTNNLRAIIAFGIGLEAMDAGDYTRATRHFAEAARLDPGFALAREKANEARDTGAAATTSTTQLIEKAGIESSPANTGALDVVMPNPLARDPVAEVLGTETVGRKTILELIFRRPN